jgi:hypothetical protein
MLPRRGPLLPTERRLCSPPAACLALLSLRGPRLVTCPRPPPPHSCSPQVVESTGCVVSPYLEYPQLLGVLLRMLSEGGAGVRREVMKVLGIVGALDPHTHKLNLAELQGEGRLEREGVRPQLPSRDAPDPGEGGQPLRPQRCACACRAGLPVSRTPRLGCWLSPQLPPGPTSPTGRCRGCGRRG